MLRKNIFSCYLISFFNISSDLIHNHTLDPGKEEPDPQHCPPDDHGVAQGSSS